jgi:hypothetical protein
VNREEYLANLTTVFFLFSPFSPFSLFHFADSIGHLAGGTPATQYAQRITQYEERSPLFFYFIILKKSCQLSVVGCQPSVFCRPSSIITRPSFFSVIRVQQTKILRFAQCF